MRRLILLVGPTCTGKSTVEVAMNKRGIPSLVSYTTRHPRTGERDGEHYHFVTKAEVMEMESNGEVIQRVEFVGNYYGTSKTTLAAAFDNSNVAVSVVEPTGVKQFKDYAKTQEDFEVIAVYLDNPLSRLTKRLVHRAEFDAQADPAYYWGRLIDLVANYELWRVSHKWDFYVLEHDDLESKVLYGACSTRMVVDHLIDTYTR